MRWKDENWDLKSEADKWRNAVSKNGLLYEDLGITYAHPNGETKSALDHIYFSSNSTASNCRKTDQSFSDHFPILVDLDMKKPVQPKKHKFILRRNYKNFH